MALEAVTRGALRGVADVCAIITDDRPQDLDSGPYVAHPRQKGRWIMPRDLTNAAGERVDDICFNIPSSFRSLPLSDRGGRIEQKHQFENRVFAVMQRTGADILVSDHYLAKIDFLISPSGFGLYGRVLNTHPGITRADHPYPCRGKDPEQLALHHAAGQHPWTGASFHIVSPEIDAGPVLCDAELTPVDPDDSPAAVIERNYRLSKTPVFLNGIRHYASHIYPQLERVWSYE